METRTLSITLPLHQIEALQKVAKNNESTEKTFQHAVEHYINFHESWEEGIERALNDVKEGRVIDGELAFKQIEEEFGL